jgi:hypothetical protein
MIRLDARARKGFAARKGKQYLGVILPACVTTEAKHLPFDQLIRHSALLFFVRLMRLAKSLTHFGCALSLPAGIFVILSCST